MATTPAKRKTAPKAPKAKPAVREKAPKMDSLSAPVFTQGGKETGSISLPPEVFQRPWRADLVHQVVTGMQSNARASIAHTKTRSEVRGGKKKPWSQKGTGRARHGSTRSNIWKGGGIALGPRNEKSYAKGIPKGMRAEALASVLTKKFAEGEVLFVDSLSLNAPKTKEAISILKALGTVRGFNRMSTKKKNAALFLLVEKNDAVEKSFRNIGSVSVEEARNLNPVSALQYTYLVIEKPEAAVSIWQKRVQ